MIVNVVLTLKRFIMKTNLLGILMLLIATGAFAQNVNLLDTMNGGFEKGDASNWRFIEIDDGHVVDDLSTLEIQTEDVTEGTYAAKWTQPYSPNHVEMVFDMWDPLAPPCVADADYTVKFDAYMSDGYGTLVVCFGFFDENGGFLGDVKDYSLVNPGDKDAFPPEWSSYEKVVHSPANAVSIYIGFRIYNQDPQDGANRWPLESESPVVVYIDNVQIIGPAPEATAIREKYVNGDVKIYPNPVVNTMSVESEANINSISICDMTGRVVKLLKANSGNTAHVNLEGLSKGMYFVKVKSQNGTSLTKVVKR